MSKEEIRELSKEDKAYYVGKLSSKVASTTIATRRLNRKYLAVKKVVETIYASLVMASMFGLVILVGLRPDLAPQFISVYIVLLMWGYLLISSISSVYKRRYMKSLEKRSELEYKLSLYEE